MIPKPGIQPNSLPSDGRSAKSESRDIRPSICILSMSAIADDPRVRRQGDCFAAAGWHVIAVGLPGARAEPPIWTIVEAQPAVTRWEHLGWLNWLTISHARKWIYWRLTRPIVRRFLSSSMGWLWPWRKRMRNSAAALKSYWKLNPTFTDISLVASAYRTDIYIANDWNMLPIARQLAERNNAIFTYDTHELATEEYSERGDWVLLDRPLIQAIESEHIGHAQVVSCVSSGIGLRLHELYELPAVPLVIRNAPTYEAHAFRPAGERIGVLYHGIVSIGRGLEACIRSVRQWRREFYLTIRGPVGDAYRRELEAIIVASGVASRVVLAPQVPMKDLVRQAAPFDVGLFALPGHSSHNDFALPNKFFEYAMAGLALCISDLPEMSNLVRQYDLGTTFKEVTPEAIADAINGLDRVAIDHYKRQALAAARELCWEHEGQRLMAAYTALMQKRRAA